MAPRPTASEIVELRVYPIKSCRGVKIEETMLTRQGLALDRRWMLVDAQTLDFITIRNNPRMTLIDTALSADMATLTISVRGDSDVPAELCRADDDDDDDEKNRPNSVSIPTVPSPEWLAANTSRCAVTIWETPTDAFRYSDAINALFSSFLSTPVALVMKGPSPRICGGNGAEVHLGREESVAFPDVLPLQIANRASLRELNARLKAKGERELTVERFRPNIIVDGPEAEPWSEDVWKTVRISEPPAETDTATAAMTTTTTTSTFSSVLSTLTAGYLGAAAEPQGVMTIDVVARCARCQVPNVDPDTANKHPKQPWDTLVSYRRVDPGMKWKPCFGMLGCPRPGSEGKVKVGMRFEVLERMGEGKWVGKEHVYETGF